MNSDQLTHYSRLPDHTSKAEYLVRIKEAPDFKTALSQMAKRAAAVRRTRAMQKRATPAPAVVSRVSMAYWD